MLVTRKMTKQEEKYCMEIDAYMLRKTLDKIVQEHQADPNMQYLDANWVCVKYVGKDWRFAKKIGCKKDYYYGWIFYSTSTNSAGTALCDKIINAVQRLSLSREHFVVRERQL